MTWNWDFEDEEMRGPESRIIIEIEEVGEGTEVTFIHEGLPGKQAVEGHIGGCVSALSKLDGVL